MNEKTLSLGAALERLSDAAKPHSSSIVAFDADGTLWSDDVGWLVFDYALRENLLHERAADQLGQVCKEINPNSPVPVGSARRARQLLSEYGAGRIGDKLLAEVQVWAYAGLREEAAYELAEAALREAPRSAVFKPSVFSLVEKARTLGSRVVVVSASPEWVVALAARELGFESSDVIGGRARVVAGFIEPELDGKLPYGEAKVTSLRQRFGPDPLLLATGDSGFDLDLLGAAEFGLGVGKKPRLLAGIAELPHCFLLEGA